MFLHWWLRQLSELLPKELVRAVTQRTDAAIIDVGSEGISLLLQRDGKLSCLLRTRAQDEASYRQVAQTIAGLDTPPRQLLVRIPTAIQLRKPVSFPLAARGDLESLIGFEMDRETPFGRNEVYWTYLVRKQDAASGRLDIELFIVPRSSVDPIIAAIRAVGLEASGIELGTEADPAGMIRLGAARRWEWIRRDRQFVRTASIAAGVVLFLIATPFLYQQIAVAIVNSRIEGLSEQAREASGLRQTVDEAHGVLDLVSRERTRLGGTLDVLAAATRLVPDDSHLTALSLRSGRMTISGLSPAAARLVDLLAQSPAFREPAFDSPVVQNDESGLETFTISASLAPEGMKDVAKKIAQEPKADQTEQPPNPPGAPNLPGAKLPQQQTAAPKAPADPADDPEGTP